MADVNPGGISWSNIGITWGHRWMDGIVGKTLYNQTYNSLPPCQEIDISCHKLSQNDDFVSKCLSSVAAILKPRFRGPRDSDFPADPDFGPGP